jgi:hypothetical protein
MEISKFSTLPEKLKQFLHQRIFVTISSREESRWGWSADEPIGITFIEWTSSLKKKIIDDYEDYLIEEKLISDKKEWANPDLICIALVGVTGTPKNPLSLYDEASGFFFIDTKKWTKGDGPILIAVSDDWKLKEVAKSFNDLHLYACIKCMGYLKD